MKSNLDPKVESALCYLPFVGWIAAIIFLVIEKNPDVRFNAAQSEVLFLVSWALMLALGATIILAIFSPLVGLGTFVLQLVLVVKAYQGQKVELPIVSEVAKKILDSFSPKK